jgi:tetratricopeptide (TPR) repeat protein/SAM-dependent methyltransferase
MPAPGEGTKSALARAAVELQQGGLGSAEAIYREILSRDPDQAEATHFLGICLLQTGRREEGLALLRRSALLSPAEPGYRRNLALALADANRLAEAEQILREAIAAAPGISWFHNFFGVVLQRRGELQAALQAYARALELDPKDDTAHNHLGYALLESGNVAAAIERLRGAVRLNPRNAMAHNNLGNALRARGDLEEAEASYRSAIALEPGLAHAHYNLGVALQDQGKIAPAIECYRAAARLTPDTPGFWQAFADALASVRFRAPDPQMRKEIEACLEREDVEPKNLALAAFSLLRTDPAFESAAHRAPLLRLLLENVVMPDPDFESFLRRLRDRLRLECASIELTPAALELACAVAQQCFLNEYVLGETLEESSWLESIEPAGEPMQLALYAAYRPLRTLPAARAIDIGSKQGPLARLIRRQVMEPAEELRLRKQIPALTEVEGNASSAVRAQYEQNPYPRWHRAPSFAGAHSLGAKLRTLFPHLAPGDVAVPDRPEILIAGCGTGRHAVITARLYPAARILAVDLSEASLAFALRRCRELGIENVRLGRADILGLGGLGERFDLIECAGVLHHLDDPIAGWRVLTELLRPRGFMRIALYSEIAHRGVVAAKDFVAKKGFAATADGIRGARAAILALPDGALERSVLGLTDFYSLSECRDLLFHARDHRFNARGIDAALRALDLEFLGFELDSPAVLRAYRAEYPDDVACASLPNWDAFEARHPDTFLQMYQFWVRRKSRG